MNWDENGLTLKINFTKPILVSRGKLFDKAKLKVKNPNLFVS
jgi:hypothetical protein